MNQVITAALESEREIIATVVSNPHLMRVVALTGHEFQGPAAAIWVTAKRLDTAGSLAPASLLDALSVEARAYVMSAMRESLALTWSLDGHVSQVLDRFRCAELARLGSQLIEHAREERTADEVLAAHTSELTELGKTVRRSGLQQAGDVALQELERIESGATVKGVGIGIHWFDVEIGGTVPGEVCIVAARPGMGKTALLVQGTLTALKAGFAVLFVSAEMPSRLLMWRFLAHITGAPIGAFRNGALNRTQWKEIYAAASWLKQQPFEIVDRIPSLPTLWSETHRWAARHHDKPRALYVDYLQRLPIKQQRGETRNDAIGAVSWAFTELAKQYEMPVTLAAQLNRAVEQQDRKPQMSDLRDSGNIEQDASQIIFPWRPDIYGEPTKAELIVAKNRNGEAGVCCDLHFQADTGRFTQTESYR